MLELRHLNKNDEKAFWQAIKDFPTEEGFSFIPSFEVEGLSFQEILQTLDDYEKGKNLPDGFVPDSLLFAFDSSGHIVGRCSIRHELNEFLLKYAGHVGYGVVPKYRRKGHASEILKQSLHFCKNHLNLHKILITCDDNNIGSIKTLSHNGFDNYKIFQDERLRFPKRHYWIDLDELI